MYVVIVGAGEVGTYLARILIEEGHDVALIEQDEKVVQRVEKELDALVVYGNGASTRALNAAGIRHADLFIAVTNLDEINMFTCLAAKKLGSPQTIARVRDTRYMGDYYSLTAEDLDIDLILGAEHVVAEHIGRLFRFPGLATYEFLADGRLALIETPIKDTFGGCGRPVAELSLPTPGNLIALQRDQEFLIPRGDTVLEADDQVFVLTVPDRVEDFLRYFGLPRIRLHKALIIGGGVFGFHTARYLEELGYTPTVMEANPERARWIAQRLHRSIVLEADATDIDILREQIEDGADAVAVLLKEEEKSLLIGMYAKHAGARQVVTRVDDFDYAPVAYKADIDSLISPQRALAQAILERVRKGRIARAMMLGDNKVEILEFNVPSDEVRPICDVPLAELGLPQGALLGAILRRGEEEEVIVPRGSDSIQPGDHVIVSVLPEAIPAVEELFS